MAGTDDDMSEIGNRSLAVQSITQLGVRGLSYVAILLVLPSFIFITDARTYADIRKSISFCRDASPERECHVVVDHKYHVREYLDDAFTYAGNNLKYLFFNSGLRRIVNYYDTCKHFW